MSNTQSTENVPDIGPHSGERCAQLGAPIKGTFFLGGIGMDGYYI